MNCNSQGRFFRRRVSHWLPILLTVLGSLCCAASPAGAESVQISGTGVVNGVAVTSFSASTSGYSVERHFSVNNFNQLPPVSPEHLGSATGMAYADLGGVLKLYEAGSGNGGTLAGTLFQIRGHFSGPATSLAPFGFNGTGWAVPVSLDVHGSVSGDVGESVRTDFVMGGYDVSALQAISASQVIHVGESGHALSGRFIVADNGLHGGNSGSISILGSLNGAFSGTFISHGAAAFQDTATLRFDLPAGVSFKTDSGVVFSSATATPVPSTLVMSLILFGLFGVVWSYKRLKVGAATAA